MKKAKKIIGIILLILIILGGAFAFLYLKTDILDFMKKPKDLFSAYLKQNRKELDEFGFEELSDQVKNKSWEENGEINWEISIKDIDDEETKMGMDILNNTKINYNAKGDLNENKFACNFDIIYNGEKIETIEGIFTEKLFGIKLGDIYNKYLVVKNENLNEMAKNYGLENYSAFPDKIKFNNQEEQEGSLTKEQIDEMKDRYIKAIEDSISEGCYTRSNEEITIDGEKVQTKAYTLELTDSELKGIIKAVLKEMQNDDVLLEYLVKTINETNKAQYGDDYQEISKAELKAFVAYVSYGINDYFDDAGEITIIVYEKNGKTVRTKVVMPESEIVLDRKEGNTTTNYVLTFKTEDEEPTKIYADITNEKDFDELKISFKEEEMKLELTAKMNKSKTESESLIYFETEEMSAKINNTSKWEYKDVEIDDSKVLSNAEILNNKTQEQLDEILSKIQENLEKFAQKFVAE